MKEMPLASLLLGSAAIGALVSSLITLIGQYIERKARREELLISEAIKLSMAHKDSLIEFAKMTQQNVYVPEHAKLAQTYFIALRSLIGTGKLPKGMYSADSSYDQKKFQDKYGG